MKLYSKADGIKKVKSMKATGGAKVYKIKKVKTKVGGKNVTMYNLLTRNKSHSTGRNPFGLDMVKGAYLIPVVESLAEEINHPVYGSHKTNFLVTRPFDVFIKTGRLEPTGVYSTPGPGGSKEMFRDKGMKVKAKKGMQISNLPGGIFLIDRQRKKAFEIIHQKGGTGRKNYLQKVALADIENYVDYVTWKNWLKR